MTVRDLSEIVSTECIFFELIEEVHRSPIGRMYSVGSTVSGAVVIFAYFYDTR